MGVIGDTYSEGRQRITELVSHLGREQATTIVPTCPEWTVRDVVAHLAGVCADVLAGNIEGVATEPWTAAQVEARTSRSVAELVEEWTAAATQVEAFADDFPGRVGAQWVLDMTSHEHDLRGALAKPGARDSAGVATGVDFLVRTGVAAGVTAAGLGPFEIKVEEGTTWIVGADVADPRPLDDLLFVALLGGEDLGAGEGAPVAALSASSFELMRALSGRRSLEQVASLDWSVDPAPYLPLFTWGPFTPSPTPIVE